MGAIRIDLPRKVSAKETHKERLTFRTHMSVTTTKFTSATIKVKSCRRWKSSFGHHALIVCCLDCFEGGYIGAGDGGERQNSPER